MFQLRGCNAESALQTCLYGVCGSVADMLANIEGMNVCALKNVCMGFVVGAIVVIARMVNDVNVVGVVAVGVIVVAFVVAAIVVLFLLLWLMLLMRLLLLSFIFQLMGVPVVADQRAVLVDVFCMLVVVIIATAFIVLVVTVVVSINCCYSAEYLTTYTQEIYKGQPKPHHAPQRTHAK